MNVYKNRCAFVINKLMQSLVADTRVSPACRDPDFDLAEGSSSDSFDSVVFVRIIPKNHKRNTFIYTELEIKRNE